MQARTHAATSAAVVALALFPVTSIDTGTVAALCAVASGSGTLPDLDHAKSAATRTLGILGRPIHWVVNRLGGNGHRKGTHTAVAGFLVAAGVYGLARTPAYHLRNPMVHGHQMQAFPVAIFLTVLLSSTFGIRSLLTLGKWRGAGQSVFPYLRKDTRKTITALCSVAAAVWLTFVDPVGALLLAFTFLLGYYGHLFGDLLSGGTPVLAPLALVRVEEPSEDEEGGAPPKSHRTLTFGHGALSYKSRVVLARIKTNSGGDYRFGVLMMVLTVWALVAHQYLLATHHHWL
jgi:hypothetical protein